MKILIVNSNFEGGGIRQALINLLENTKNGGDDINVQLFKTTGIDEARQRFKNTKIRICKSRYFLYMQGTPLVEMLEYRKYIDVFTCILFRTVQKLFGKRRVFCLLSRFIKKTEQYDIAISYANDIWKDGVLSHYNGCNDYVLKNVNAKRKIAWIHNDPKRLGFTDKLCKDIYKDFDEIVNVSYACKNMFDKIIPEFEYKSKVVYNMFDVDRVIRLSNEQSPYSAMYFNIVTVARIENKQKRIDRVIECCLKLKQSGFRNFTWTVVGEGPDMKQLKKSVEDNNLTSYVNFVGRKSNPYPYMKHADVFVQTSDYEAHSMVLLEALSVGTPIISTNYGSACEIVKDGINGILVDFDVNNIYNAVKTVILDKNLLNKLRSNIKNIEINNQKSLNQFYELLK